MGQYEMIKITFILLNYLLYNGIKKDVSHTALAMAFYALVLMRTVGGPGCA